MGTSQPPGFTGGRLITYETSYAPYSGSFFTLMPLDLHL